MKLGAEFIVLERPSGQSLHKNAKNQYLYELLVAVGSAADSRAVLEKYPFVAEDFTAPAQEEPNKGESALSLLAAAACNGFPQALLAVLDKYQFEAQDFTVVAQPRHCKCVLWWLAAGAENGFPEALLVVLRKYPSLVKDFTALAAASQLESILAYTDFDLAVLRHIKDAKLPKSKLAQKRCDFSLSIAINEGTDELFKKATDAFDAGYLEAFYSLGLHFEKLNKKEDAMKSFLKMTKESCFFEPVFVRYAAECIGLVTNASEESVKLSYLKKALKFTLRISDDEVRSKTLNIIARLYVGIKLGAEKFGLNEPDVIPPYLLACMNDSCTANWCLAAFDEIVSKKKLENEVCCLKRKNSELENKSSNLENEIASLKANKYQPENSSENNSDEEQIRVLKEVLFMRRNAKRKAQNLPPPSANVENESSKTMKTNPSQS